MRTNKEYEHVIELINIGKTKKEISEITGVPYRTIRDWIKKKPRLHFTGVSPYWDELKFREAVSSSLSMAETLKKLNIIPAGGNYSTAKSKLKQLGIDSSHWRKVSPIKGKTHKWARKVPIENVLVENCPHSRAVLRKAIIRDKIIEYSCKLCSNNGKWLNLNLSLHLDHINGVNDDNRIENLRFLCPNCHSQTNSYCGKNIKRI